MNKSATAYRTSATLGKSPIDLILTVYDGTIKAFGEADAAYSAHDLARGREALEQAKKCLTHLYTTLDFDQGGEIAGNLAKLYVFLLNQTELALATKDLKIIRDNAQLLRTVREGWSGVKQQQAGQAPATTTKSQPITVSA